MLKDDKKTKGVFLGHIVTFIIRLMLITDKKNFDVNFLDLNIRKYIEHDSATVGINGDINKVYTEVFTIKEKIKKYIGETKIIEEFYYLIHLLVIKNSLLFNKIKFLNNEQFKMFNTISSYRDKDKVLSKENINKKYNELIEILNNTSEIVDDIFNNKTIIIKKNISIKKTHL